MSVIRYREASSADVNEMARCRLQDPDAGAADPRMAAYLDGMHHPHRALPPRVAYVAMADDVVVGYIAGHLTRRLACHGEVQYLFVAPARRRQGIASALLRRLAEWFARQRVMKVCVNVNRDSAGAAPFYVSRGAIALNEHWCRWDDVSAVHR